MTIRSGPMRPPNTSQTTLAASDVSANVSPIPLSTSHSPIQYIKPEPINRVDDIQAAMSAQDLKRKRQCVETGVSLPTSTAQNPSPSSMEYFAPVYVAEPPFIPEAYHNLQGFPAQADSTPAQPPPESFGEDMDASAFPYYFHY
ncbi:hypothetical protein N7520_004157 [Penicillium odoratum]|uniref:uncharacterized protein n=1 Tax=Penicillium odoratum TaxID=1167516 RepID=UPI0025466857|nr:uncharacterized protein N7520_004157 [Penicillium odoratum]KAJ5769598.1 hypothetical protein N7520_004157 [Penicillium odoratum]